MFNIPTLIDPWEKIQQLTPALNPMRGALKNLLK